VTEIVAAAIHGMEIGIEREPAIRWGGARLIAWVIMMEHFSEYKD
jgi:hypothetical protein